MEKQIKSDMDYIVTLILIVSMVIANIYLFNKNIKEKKQYDIWKLESERTNHFNYPSIN